MAIPSVVNGWIHTDDESIRNPETVTGLEFLNNPKGFKWLDTVNSFRYVPTDELLKPYTVRKESNKSGDYWYGYRKVAGRLHKKYIGKTSELWTGLLDEIAETLNTPPEPRAVKIASVRENNNQQVTDKVTADRLTALELQVQALQESLEALRSELPGKFAEGDSSELPNPDTVTDSELQIRVGNLESENEKLRGDYVALLESSTHVTNKLREELRELRELRSQLATERAAREEIEAELADLKQNSAPASELLEKTLPDAATILSQLRGKRKKTPVTLADIEAILGMIEKSCDDTSQED